MALQNGSFTRTNGANDQTKNYPRFHMESVPDALASEQQGRPIFRDEERVEIFMPGNHLSRPVQRVTDEHRQIWPKEYEAFKKGEEFSLEGTPLEQWPVLRRSQVLELKALGVLTVEHVRDLSDLAVQRIGMGGRGLRDLAKGYLDDAAAGALANRLTAENDRKDAEIALLRRQVEEMGSRMEQVHGELQGMKNAPSPLLTHIPGMNDPMEQARQSVPVAAPAGSSLDMMAKRGPGRPRKTEAA